MLAERVIEWTEEWKQQGLEEGLRKGLRKGRQEGEVTLLERLLTRRFGPLDETCRARLAAANTDQLENWAIKVLDATTLDDVFEEH